MAALVVIGLAQFSIATALLIFASYSDHKVRKVSDVIWVIMGLSAVIILAVQLLESDSFTSISLGLMPVMGLLTYFLICDWLVDFEDREMNFPWVIILSVVVFTIIAQAYWLGLSIHQIVLIFAFFMIFIILEVIMLHLDFAHYKAGMEDSDNESKKVSKVTSKAGSKQLDTKGSSGGVPEKKPDEAVSKPDYIGLSSWIFTALIIVHFTASIVLFHSYISNEPLEFYTGVFGVLIPIIVLVLYFIFFDWKLFPQSSKQPTDPASRKNAEGPEDRIGDQPILINRRRGMGEKLGWAFVVVLGFVIVFNAVIYSQDNYLPEHYLATFSVQVWIVIFYAFYNLGIPKGGADTKALMALSVLFPTYVFYEPVMVISTIDKLIDALPGIEFLITFTLSVLINATIITILIPVALLIYNISRRNMVFPLCFFGYKMDLNKVLEKHVWLMEYVDDDGELIAVLFPRHSETESVTVNKLSKKGLKDVWVTPKIPFIIPMTIGFMMNFILGNILFVIMFASSGI